MTDFKKLLNIPPDEKDVFIRAEVAKILRETADILEKDGSVNVVLVVLRGEGVDVDLSAPPTPQTYGILHHAFSDLLRVLLQKIVERKS